MRDNFVGVPFKAETAKGLSETNGIAKFSEAGIVIEYESKLLGFIGSDVKEVRIGLNEILDIKFGKGIYKFFSTIRLRLKSISELGKLPNEGGKVKLKIKREDFEHAQNAVELINAILEGNTYDRPIAEVLPSTKPGELPPPQTSVNELFETEKLVRKNQRETNKLDGE